VRKHFPDVAGSDPNPDAVTDSDTNPDAHADANPDTNTDPDAKPVAESRRVQRLHHDRTESGGLDWRSRRGM
jgi:hypothetical protein